MARRPFIAGNWKLNLGPAHAGALASELKQALAQRGAVDVAVFPTALSIHAVRAELLGSGVEVGVQEVAAEPHGALTGTNSVVMAREAGCTRALVGHSERRQLFGETLEGTAAKVGLCLGAGVLPILCVGETLAEREAGHVDTIVHAQLAGGLAGLKADQVATVTLAYEPVWAIGTGVTASPAQAQEVHASIRRWLAQRYPSWVAEGARLLYGGSVKPANAAELLSCPDIDGALVGGASLQAQTFAAIVAAATS